MIEIKEGLSPDFLSSFPDGPIAVAMSGGVDSAVAAALLQKEGRSLFGVHIILQGEKDPETHPSFLAARQTAHTLGIELFAVDLRESFRRRIMDYFADAYLSGLTPNPCVLCNPTIKLGELFDWARTERGAVLLATGHYARVVKGHERWELWRGRDATKDQSYYLALLSQRQLSRFLTPLGAMEKKDVRALAAQLALPAAESKESQDVCFIPDGDYKKFMESDGRDVNIGPGDILDEDGRILGRHEGYWRYTLGQRKGLRVSAAHPLYVIAVDSEKNQVVVGPKGSTFRRKLVACEMNYVSMNLPQSDFSCQAQIRYRSPAVEVAVSPLDEHGARIQVRCEQDQSSITPGQALVLYDGARVLAGGWIESVL